MRNRTATLLTAGVTAALTLAAPAPSAAADWTWPVRGPVITRYANDNARPFAGGMHRGVDIAAPVGTRVGAAGAGRVTYAGMLGTSGLVVAVLTSNRRYATSYLHLSMIAVEKGDTVGAGQKLGEVGKSGRPSTREPHLHFGVRLGGRERFYVDPLTLLPALSAARASVPALPAPVPVRPTVHPALAPVPMGPRAVPVSPHRLPVPRVAAREPVPVIAWGPLVSLAGLLLLGAVLALRLQGDSGSRRGEHGAQPATRAAAGVGRLGSVSQVG
jgi:hypothetical protein